MLHCCDIQVLIINSNYTPKKSYKDTEMNYCRVYWQEIPQAYFNCVLERDPPLGEVEGVVYLSHILQALKPTWASTDIIMLN